MEITPALSSTAFQACLAALKDTPQRCCKDLDAPKGSYIRWKAEGPDPKELTLCQRAAVVLRGEEASPFQVLWLTGASAEQLVPSYLLMTVCRQAQDLGHAGSWKVFLPYDPGPRKRHIHL